MVRVGGEVVSIYRQLDEIQVFIMAMVGLKQRWLCHIPRLRGSRRYLFTEGISNSRNAIIESSRIQRALTPVDNILSAACPGESHQMQ